MTFIRKLIVSLLIPALLVDSARGEVFVASRSIAVSSAAQDFNTQAITQTLLWLRNPRHALITLRSRLQKSLMDEKPTTPLELEAFFESSSGVLITAGKRAPTSIHQVPMFKGLHITVFDREGESSMFAANYLQALRDHGNRVTVVSLSQHEPLKNPTDRAEDIYIIPAGDREIEKRVGQLAEEFHIPLNVLSFQTENLAQLGAVNLSIGSNASAMSHVLQALGLHVSQLARTRYDLMMRHYLRGASMLANYLGIDSHGQEFSNNFVMAEMTNDGNVQWLSNQKFHLQFEGEPSVSGFASIPMPRNGSVLEIAPHPDDPEIAMGLAMSKCLSNGVNVVNVIHGSGHAGYADTLRVYWEAFWLFRKQHPQDVVRLIERLVFKGIAREDEDDLAWAWKFALRDVKVDKRFPEATMAAQKLERSLQVSHPGRLKVDYLKLDVLLETGDQADAAAAYQLAYKAYRMVLIEQLVRAPGAPFLVFLPHPLDSHGSHTRATASAHDVLGNLKREFPDVRILLAHYLAPWAGGTNTYFHSRENVLARGPLAEISAEFKKGLAYLTGELAGRFGGKSPDPSKMGGFFAERFTRFIIYPANYRRVSTQKEWGPIAQPSLHPSFYIDKTLHPGLGLALCRAA